MKIKVTPRILGWLNGTGIGDAIAYAAGPDDLRPEMFGDPEDEWAIATMILKVRNAQTRADGSMWPDLSWEEMNELREWSDYFANASSDTAKDANATGEMGGLADLNAARAQVRRCDLALQKMKENLPPDPPAALE